MKVIEFADSVKRMNAVYAMAEQLKKWKQLNPTKPEFVFWDELKEKREREHKLERSKLRSTSLTNAVCTASCWLAVGFDCRCSCGGKNHGIGHAPEPVEVTP